ncbi:Hypothetical predicted protein [Octopus vulgaris]|uniref:Uncharacterized protein n=1 Tax=Octopus vulgaris TaxID=6645 RepID=A0AA36F8W9_OCTVU|nr:Hypothetical predicted protein [Octopus vulgaris]
MTEREKENSEKSKMAAAAVCSSLLELTNQIVCQLNFPACSKLVKPFLTHRNNCQLRITSPLNLLFSLMSVHVCDIQPDVGSQQSIRKCVRKQ